MFNGDTVSIWGDIQVLEIVVTVAQRYKCN